MLSGKLDSKRSRRGFNSSGTDNLDDVAPASSLIAKVSVLEKDLERRQESYVARERAYKTRIQELEEELSFVRQTKTGWMKSDGKMEKLKSMQGQIMKNVELVQDRTSRVLQEQERDLLRAFRARLFDVQTELEKEKSKKEDGAGAWIERSRTLESEVEWAKEVADRLERVNQTLLTDNARLKSQFHSQEEDRNFLIVQLVNVKKENAQLKAEYSAIGIENEAYQNQMKLNEEAMKSCTGSSNNNNGGTTGAGGRHGGGLRDNYTASTRGHIGDSTDEKYKEINTRLRRLLAEERKALQSVRLNYSTELRSRTEMEMLLRQCVDDVRKEISLRTFNTSSKVGSRPSSSGASMALGPATSSFTQGDRERALELLLSQERVISLVYAKTFPTNQSNKSKSLGATLDMSSGGQSGSSDITGRADNDILQAISLGLSSSAIALFKSRDSDECNLDLPISEGGGGPLIVAALMDCGEIAGHSGSTKLPAISRHETLC